MTESSSDKETQNLKEKCENSASSLAVTTANNESLDWKDAHLQDFIAMKFPELDEKNEVNIACQFLTYLFTGHISNEINLPKLLFLTASFLRSPKEPINRLIDSSYLCVREKHFRINIVYRADIFLDHLLRKHTGQDLSVVLFRESLIRIRGNGIVAYASLLATVVIRMVAQSPESIHHYISSISTKTFNKYFPQYRLHGELPEISLQIVGTFSQMSLSSHWLFQNFFSYLLATYKKEFNDGLIKGYLLELILRQTSYYGLRLIKNYEIVKNKFRVDSEVFGNCFCGNNKAKESLDLLIEFDRNYDKDGNVLWQWARLIKTDYFFKFSRRHHLDLALIFTALEDSFEGSAIWRAEFLKHATTDQKAEAKKLAESLLRTIRNQH